MTVTIRIFEDSVYVHHGFVTEVLEVPGVPQYIWSMVHYLESKGGEEYA